MTRSATLTPPSAELSAIADDVAVALREGRFDEAFYQRARQRVADARGGFKDNFRLLQAAEKAGVIPSALGAIGVTP